MSKYPDPPAENEGGGAAWPVFFILSAVLILALNAIPGMPLWLAVILGPVVAYSMAEILAAK